MKLGPYEAKKGGIISYKGNKIFRPIKDISKIKYPTKQIEGRVKSLASDPMWGHIARINHRINISSNEYFNKLGAIFTALPLTTRMISSPGAVYGKEAISYTTDTSPITLNWFDLPGNAFLSESSQIYLELSLLQKGIDHVYSVYNSFRKEEADPTHLSEFHHIEYEGKVSQKENLKIICGLITKIVKDLLDKNREDMAYFLTKDKLKELKKFSRMKEIPQVKFSDVLKALYEDTKNPKYKKFTLKHFSSWEEIRVTELFGGIIAITEFPLLEVPFYHAVVDGKTPKVANNADIIWPGYRETVGSGHRVRTIKELEEKAKIFELPRNDYKPYLQSRRLHKYVETSGFGLGWERLLQGLLEMPFIWSASQFPRGHTTLKP